MSRANGGRTAYSTVIEIVVHRPSCVRCSSSPICNVSMYCPAGSNVSYVSDPSPKCTHGSALGMASPTGRHSVSMAT